LFYKTINNEKCLFLIFARNIMTMNDEKKILSKEFFYPRSVAVIGVSADENAFGTRYLSALLKFGFKGKLYPVNPRGGSLFGLTVYPSLSDIPEGVELAAISVPGRSVPLVLEDCLVKGIKAAIVLSAGFSESGEEGKRLEEKLPSIISKGIRVIGPNCHGVYCPRSGLTLLPGSNFPQESGQVGLVTQSGQFAEMIVLQSRGLGIRYSKVISYGNACDLNESDFLEYLADDLDTKVMAAYIEGVKQGRRFLEVVRRTSKIKPVLIWKVGLTNTGRKAVSSHTGSIAGDEAVWNSFFTQSGAVRIDSIDDLIDSTIAFLHLPPRCGRRIALVTGSGGGAVIGADACDRLGFEMPSLSPKVQQKIASFLPPIGTNVRNPVDLSSPAPHAKVLIPILEAVASCEQIDAIILGRMFLSVKGPGFVLGYPKSFEQGREELMNIPVMIKEKFGKPIIMVLSEEVTDSEMIEFEADRRILRDYYLTHSIPVYPTLERAMKALARAVKYQERFYRYD
jgi:acyl-CoA synthetase (NDP forming)